VALAFPFLCRPEQSGILLASPVLTDAELKMVAEIVTELAKRSFDQTANASVVVSIIASCGAA